MPAAWGNQYHLFALSLAVRSPIHCFSSFLLNSNALEPSQRWAAGESQTLAELQKAFSLKDKGTSGATRYLATREDEEHRPLLVFLAHGHFSALLRKPGRSFLDTPEPHSIIIPPLHWSMIHPFHTLHIVHVHISSIVNIKSVRTEYCKGDKSFYLSTFDNWEVYIQRFVQLIFSCYAGQGYLLTLPPAHIQLEVYQKATHIIQNLPFLSANTSVAVYMEFAVWKINWQISISVCAIRVMEVEV